MAEAYSKALNKISAVCVTAGPGATNAIPGLAEAFVDSAPIIVLSGQVEKNSPLVIIKIIILDLLVLLSLALQKQ